MLSIITAVHNQLPMNRLFMQRLRAATRQPFELIVIDNASSDGSGDWFREQGAVVIANTQNLSYPVTQNQGIAVARHDWLVFMNNDVIPGPGWDEALVASMQANGLEVATCCGIERVESAQETKRLKRRWQRIKGLVSLFGTGEGQLALMHRLMYPDWEGFCRRRREAFRGQVLNGFVGNTVAMQRSAIDKLGLWDERIQAADFDLYLRVAKRRQSHGDMKDVHIVLDCFIHHYIRLTLKATRTPFADAANLMPLERKWDAGDLRLLEAATFGH